MLGKVSWPVEIRVGMGKSLARVPTKSMQDYNAANSQFLDCLTDLALEHQLDLSLVRFTDYGQAPFTHFHGIVLTSHG